MTLSPAYLVTNYEVLENSTNVQTKAFQQVLDICGQHGGGTVIVPAGRFVIGSIRIPTDVTLKLQTGAILKGSTNITDYTDFGEDTAIAYTKDPFYVNEWHLPEHYFSALISAYHAKNVSIIGEPGSVIDGSNLTDAKGEEGFRGPMGMVMADVQNVSLSGYAFINSANWSHALIGCTTITVDDVQIRGGHDGFNLHHSSQIHIDNCSIFSGDDCLAGYDITDLFVNHCMLNTACNSMRVGGVGLHFKACTFVGPGLYPHLSKQTHYTHEFFKYYAIDADPRQKPTQAVHISESVIDDVGCLLTYRRGDKSIMQNGSDLRELCFDHCQIDRLSKTSEVHGNGVAVSLKFEHVIFGPHQASCLFNFDEAVSFNLNDVTFEAPVEINIGDKKLMLQGHVPHYTWTAMN